MAFNIISDVKRHLTYLVEFIRTHVKTLKTYLETLTL